MPASPNYLDPHALAQLEGLELKARLIVEGYVSGNHKSPYHGFSVEFAEHREYVPGDDLRYVDWKVYGKSDRVYLKQFEEETNFSCTLLVDTSESMQYRSESTALSKLDYAKHVAAALSWLIVQQQDAVGLVTFDREVTNFLPPGSQPSHLSRLIHTLDNAPTGAESEMGPLLNSLAERIRKRGLVILLSDLFDDVDALLMGLKHFRHRRHDVSIMHIVDPAEQDFPFEDPTLFKGLEGLPDQMTDPKALRDGYRAEFNEYLQQLQRGAGDLRMDYVLLRTDMPLDAAITKFLTHRRPRV